MSAGQGGIPATGIDLYTDEALRDPYPRYRRLRELGPVVHLDAHDLYAFPRYQQVREALGDWQVFSSAAGVMLNDEINTMLAGGVSLCSDPPEHTRMRSVVGRPLRPERLRALVPQIEAEAERIVERLVGRGTFDAATELAEHLPRTVVADLVGLGSAGQDRMLEWAEATFDAMGPMNPRTQQALPKLPEITEYLGTEAVPGKIDPGGWADQLYTAAERGELPVQECPVMLLDYIVPSLDTTIFGISSAIELFARNPQQWTILRADPALVPHAINEVLRLESPVQRFTRLLTRDHEVEGRVLPAGSRVLLLYGSANRDERKYPDPDRFDVRRRPADHLAFGRGEHACVGMNLARVEMRALLEALIPRVARFELLESEVALNNTLRGLRALRVRVH